MKEERGMIKLQEGEKGMKKTQEGEKMDKEATRRREER
jgi:hypothetical protein